MKEIRGNSRYWLEILEKQGPGATAKALGKYYNEMPEEELISWLSSMFDESGVALKELGEPIETTPIPFVLRPDSDDEAPHAG